MNRPSSIDEPKEYGCNKSPTLLSEDHLTTNENVTGIANTKILGRAENIAAQDAGQDADLGPSTQRIVSGGSEEAASAVLHPRQSSERAGNDTSARRLDANCQQDKNCGWRQVKHAVFTFAKFVGPGMMIAVAYIDPGNYATDVAAGASYQYRLLFVVLLSNCFAIFLQSLSIKLGTVSGLNLAEACRAFLPPWMNYLLYFMAEAAIIATDIAEVIGTAIALNLLIPQLPLVGGCAISILDVLVILLFYQPNGSMRGLRAFEIFVMLLVLGVVVCFCIQLSLIKNGAVGEVFRGYLPSSVLVEQQALYQACGILGATVMPHSLYLGSGIVQPRLREYDLKCGLLPSAALLSYSEIPASGRRNTYGPSLSAIRHCLKYSITELAISLFTFALFVNSAILIVAGASLYANPEAMEADIFGIHDLLSSSISPVAGTVFALALLLSGVSAGIVCTVAGQIVSEGALNWKLKPWVRRLVTRSVSITPSIIIAGAVGRSGLDAALNGSQVALSVVLPFVTAPLIYFTARNKYMTVQPGMARYDVRQARKSAAGATGGESPEDAEGGTAWRRRWNGVFDWAMCNGNATANDGNSVKMANAWYVTCFGILVWIMITAMNVANLVLLGRQES